MFTVVDVATHMYPCAKSLLIAEGRHTESIPSDRCPTLCGTISVTTATAATIAAGSDNSNNSSKQAVTTATAATIAAGSDNSNNSSRQRQQ
jgi:hypothetical protein